MCARVLLFSFFFLSYLLYFLYLRECHLSYIHYTGNLGRDFISSGEGSLPFSKWQLVLGIAVSLGALGYMGKLAKNALDEAEEELASEAK